MILKVYLYHEQNVKRGRALFFISKLFGFKWESGVTVFVVIRPQCGLWSGLYTFTYKVPHRLQDYTQLSCPASQQGFVYPALSQMTGGIREHVLKLVSLGHQETDVLKCLL